MGELQNAVSTLLDAFTEGIAVIKTQRTRRRQKELPIDSKYKRAEARLSGSLKRNKVDLQDAYGRDLARYGTGFATGDAEAHSSMSAILFRLNAGFVSIIERFTRGQSVQTDYQALVNLSNVTRIEAIHTFDQLSQRLSQSSLSLIPSIQQKGNRKHKRKAKINSSSVISKHTRSKSAPRLSSSPLGPASTEGWVRSTIGRKHSTHSNSSGTLLCTYRVALNPARVPLSEKSSVHSPPPILRTTPPLQKHASLHKSKVSLSQPGSKKSIMSFASDSTKLGEIPEHKWTRNVRRENFPIKPYYPLEPYEEPEKPRSRFMRLFRRS